MIQIQLDQRLPFTNKDPGQKCLIKCAAVHEWSHAEDVEKDSPFLCLGVKGVWQLEDDDKLLQNQSEVKAWTAEKKCLEDCLKTCPGDTNLTSQHKHAEDKIRDFQKAVDAEKELRKVRFPK